MAVMFSTLPVELLLNIGNETTRLKDRKALRRTCTFFGQVFKPLVLAEVTINIYHGHLDPGISLLEALISKSSSTVSQYIRILNIYSLSPSYSPEPDMDYEEKLMRCRYTYEVVEKVRDWVQVEPRTSESAIVEEKMFSILGPALKSLHNLQTVRWRWQWPRGSERELTVILESLSSDNLRQNIKEFAFHYTPASINIPIPFPNLPQLEALSLIANHDSGDTLSAVAPIISSPSLRKLHLVSGAPLVHAPLGRDIPKHITHLGLSGFSISARSPSQIIHTNLTSLELGEVRCPDARRYDTLGELWMTLSCNRIHLCSLVVSRMDDTTGALLDYLQSYSGLEVLSLMGPFLRHNPQYDNLAHRFYSDVLPLHAETLVRLEVKQAFESRWCFGEHNVEIFKRCRKLKSLSLKVDHRGLDRDEKAESLFTYEDRNLPSGTNSVHLLLDMISFSLPKLEKLTIEPARNPYYAHDHSDFMVGAAHYLGVQRRIRASVGSFVTCNSPSTTVLKWLTVYIGRNKVVFPTSDLRENVKERNIQQSDQG
ncbi:hypothetical protein GYMLUDRAFT_65624 [Collybiopsis luxurians FD-317 M1]|nr:hypothetical protein GYMLUDRAFT_65624 [Collybiopsis luxurians FD-317 M1]